MVQRFTSQFTNDVDASAESALRLTDHADSTLSPNAGDPARYGRRHTHATVLEARRLIEQTTLSCRQIATQIDVGRHTLARWALKYGWQRHPYAPPANDTVPAARAGRRRQLRMLAIKLHALAERCVVELWNDPAIDCERLIQALRTVKTIRPDALGNRCPRSRPDTRPRTGEEWADRERRIRQALAKLRRGSAEIDHIPEQAMAMVAEGHKLPKRVPRARSI